MTTSSSSASGSSPANKGAPGLVASALGASATELLRTAAVNAGRRKTALGACYRSLARRKAKQHAIVTVAHKLELITYRMVKNRTSYQETGGDEWDQVRRDRERKHLERRAKSLDLHLVDAPSEATPRESSLRAPTFTNTAPHGARRSGRRRNGGSGAHGCHTRPVPGARRARRPVPRARRCRPRRSSFGPET